MRLGYYQGAGIGGRRAPHGHLGVKRIQEHAGVKIYVPVGGVAEHQLDGNPRVRHQMISTGKDTM